MFMGCRKATATLPVAAAPPVPAPQPVPPPTITLSADRTTITAGQAVTLSWQSTNATGVTLDNAIGNVATAGTRQVSPQTTTSYTATARGAGGTAASAAVRVTVNVIPPPVAQPAVTRPAQPAPAPSLSEQFQTVMQNILFDYDEWAIRASEFPKLQSAAEWLARNPSVRFTIEGNADDRGSQEYNIALGDERAASVLSFLADRGITKSRMDAISYGEERPLCRDQREQCWEKNRRAQFVLKP
jgi:peptidoglycan-associated lipoprotein